MGRKSTRVEMSAFRIGHICSIRPICQRSSNSEPAEGLDRRVIIAGRFRCCILVGVRNWPLTAASAASRPDASDSARERSRRCSDFARPYLPSRRCNLVGRGPGSPRPLLPPASGFAEPQSRPLSPFRLYRIGRAGVRNFPTAPVIAPPRSPSAPSKMPSGRMSVPACLVGHWGRNSIYVSWAMEPRVGNCHFSYA